MQKLTDAEMLRGLKNQEAQAYRELYRCYYPGVEKFVLRNNGTRADARDVFQDAVVVLWQQTQKDDFSLTASLKTYLHAICRNRWLKRLEKARRGLRVRWERLPETEAPAFSLGWEGEPEAEKTLTLKITLWLSRITVHCQSLLKHLFLLGRSVQELGYKNKHTAQNQQYKCLQQLRRSAGAPPPEGQ